MEVSVEYGEALMSTVNCVKLMKRSYFLITLGVFMLMIK